MISTRPLFLLILFLAALSPGCAKAAHLQELLRIKGYSEEKDAQAVLVQKQNEKFERLLSAVKHGTIARYPDQPRVWADFGAPIFETTVTLDKTMYRVWMYRYSTKLFGSDKVYLYFDAEGRLKIFDYTPRGTLTAVNEVAYEKK